MTPGSGVIFMVYTHATGAGLIFCFLFVSYPYDGHGIGSILPALPLNFSQKGTKI